jgi:tRNA threonylcarbamoyladenosine biosynthesis protein TsaB
MLILALDTSGESCSVAVAQGATVLVSYHFRHERRLSERLNGIVEFVLRDAGQALEKVEAIAVGVGPGSFTGVRVGVTMAKTLALVRALPLVGISSLTALVEPVTVLTACPMVTVVPTRRTESIAAFYPVGSLQPLTPPEVFANDQVIAVARERLGMKALLLLGEAAGTIHATVPDDELRVHMAYPTADAIARLAATRLSANDFDDPDTLVPLYVTPTPVG